MPVDKSEPSVAQANWAELLTAAQAPRLLLVSLGVWLHAADELVATTMLPFIIDDIGGATLAAWVFALYETGSIIAGAASALLAARLGLGPPMSLAALLFAFGCMLSALTPSMEIMLIGRAAQGLGGGCLVAMSFVAVGALFTPAQLPRVMAAISTLWGISAFIGPLIGGQFADAGWWRGAYWFFALQALLLAFLIARRADLLRMAEAPEPANSFPALRLTALTAAVLAISAAGVAGGAAMTALMLAGGLGLLWWFFRLDAKRGADRLMPPIALSLRDPIGASLLMILSFSIATISFSIYGPILLTDLHGLSGTQAGYLVALASIGWSSAAILFAGLNERYDPIAIRIGIVLLALSAIGFMNYAVSGPLAMIGVLAFIEGAGFGIAWTFVLRRAQKLSSRTEHARYAAAMPMIQRLGYALGAAFAGIVANNAGFDDSASAEIVANVGFWIFAAMIPFALLGLAAAWRFTRNPPPAQPQTHARRPGG